MNCTNCQLQSEAAVGPKIGGRGSSNVVGINAPTPLGWNIGLTDMPKTVGGHGPLPPPLPAPLDGRKIVLCKLVPSNYTLKLCLIYEE
jgi:hypothetical protein